MNPLHLQVGKPGIACSSIRGCHHACDADRLQQILFLDYRRTHKIVLHVLPGPSSSEKDTDASQNHKNRSNPCRRPPECSVF